MINKGAKVRFKQPVIEGEVNDRRLNDQQGCIEYHVEIGEGVSRWFLEKELEVLPEEAPKEGGAQ